LRAVPAGELILVPDGLGLPEAAALLHDGSTAVGLLRETGVQPGPRAHRGPGRRRGIRRSGRRARSCLVRHRRPWRPVLGARHVRRRLRPPGPGRGRAPRRHRDRDRRVRARGLPAPRRRRAGRGRGRIRPVIGQEYPLAAAAAAHAALESRTAVAKTLLRP